MTVEEIKDAANKIQGLLGMTVNERLYVSGLWNEYDKSLKTDKAHARLILECLKVDKPSIDKILESVKPNKWSIYYIIDLLLK